MAEFCSKPDVVKFMKHKIKGKLGEGVVITNIDGRKDVVTAQATAAQIPQQFHDEPKCKDETAQKLKNIRTAADLIKMEIKNIKDRYKFYPDLSEINYIDKNKAYLPQTPRISLSEPFLGKSNDLEIEAIG